MSEISLINFIDLTLCEKLEILAWRNDSSIRKWMYNPEPITKDEHLCFIESLLNNKEKKYFIVKFDNQKIGVVDFTKIVPKKSLYMGIYVNPETKVKGCGSILLSEIIKYSFENLSVKKIYAEVFSNNKRATELYNKYGFNSFATKTINSREVICMELSYENR